MPAVSVSCGHIIRGAAVSVEKTSTNGSLGEEINECSKSKNLYILYDRISLILYRKFNKILFPANG